MEKLKKIIFNTKEFISFADQLKSLEAGRPLTVKGISGSLMAFVAVKAFEECQHQIVVIASDNDKADKLRDDCALLLNEQAVRLFGASPAHQTQLPDMHASISQLETLKALVTGSKALVVASTQSIAQKIPSPESFRRNIIEVQASTQYNFQQLIDELQQNGFERGDFVEGYGDFAVRGGILDVFPYVGENPIRIEFWGNTIESIREFDVLSQRSIRQLSAASIVPSLATTSPDSKENALNTSLFDYLEPGATIIVDEPASIEREIKDHFHEHTADSFSYEEIIQRLSPFPSIIHSIFSSGESSSAVDFASISQPSFNGSINRLVIHLRSLSDERVKSYLTADTKDESMRLRELIDEVVTSPQESEDDDVSAEKLTFISQIELEFLTGAVHSGFIIPSAKLAVFTEHEIFGRLKRRGPAKRRRFKSFSQKELQQLKPGDYVVHVDHGIGTFAGLKKIKVGNVEQEALKLLFLENDVLYVNLNYIDRVQKYSSQEGSIPNLNKLGASDWERAKARAKRRIKDIARDLIALYAKRKHEQGFTFSPDTHWQKELEASFMYEDTPDQASATLDVKRDMEDTSPMDRLICGDVGFGKTEVAVRAAFKAVMDGKQAAILVPTTILALQHYNTFQDRLSRYTTRIENITRFKSPKEQKKIVEELKQGSIDIIIGTHRLLSKDITFKDLGLLIIDEEHRFGVAAKEKLRQFKASVDTLTLTATPIPRTLHFSLMGARDLSIINTPPRNRIPILTEIISADGSGKGTQWRIVREAILHELHRDGQAYFVHDRVNNIGVIANELKSHVPEARIHVAHGQMTGHQLEKTMLDFLEKKYDVLICTKIIESGLDIPNVNTIIINRADQFGLAELYQLRGRVGRSNVQAYAYLLTPPVGALPKMTLRRLQAIEEFTELGSGFNLAMRDMEIRGTGNLLGSEQSGFVVEMGFEMYERIVSEAVAELKQEEFKEVFKPQEGPASRRDFTPVETIIDADINALIPDFYIESDAERLDIYRRLYRATSGEEMKAMRVELLDRFGEYPEEAENLFLLIELRLMAARFGFLKISLQKEFFTITLPAESNEYFYGKLGDTESPFQNIMTTISFKEKNSARLKQIGKELNLQYSQPKTNEVRKKLEYAKKKLEELEEIVGRATSNTTP